MKKIILRIIKYVVLFAILSYSGIFFARQIKEWEEAIDKEIKKIR